MSSSFEEGQKKIVDIIHYLAYKGHEEETQSILLLALKEYSLNVGQNISLEMRLNVASAAGRLKNKVID